MKIYNAKVYVDGHFIDGGIDFEEKINNIGPNVSFGDIDTKGCYIIPGLIDIHSHGAVGEDASDADPKGLIKMAAYYASKGITSWCPTTMTLKEDALSRAMSCIAAYKRPENGAKIAGINMEGPFLSSEKKGAQNEENLHKPDFLMFKRLYDVCGGNIRIVSLAPEEDGAVSFATEASKLATVSVAHTTADYDTAVSAYKAGASHATHLFNAMTGIHHRNPGVIPAVFDCGATAELIADGIHIHPAIIRLAFQLFGERLVLISDSLRCSGMPDGEYELGGQKITLKGKKAVISGTDIIAGSSINLMDGIRNCVCFGISLEKAVYAATTAPASVIKKENEIGSLKIGLSADFVILDKDLEVLAVYIDGKRI